MSNKHKFSFLILLMIGLMSIVLYNSKTRINSQPELSVEILKVPEGVKVSQMPACWSSIIYKLTFKQLFDKSDLVAIVEIIGVPITYGCWQGNYYDPYFTLYKAKIIKILKGNVSMNYIYLYLWGGYDPKYNVFLIIEGYPVFKLGDEWLLFMNKITYDRNLNVELPENTYRFVEIASLKLIEGRLYSMDNFGNKIVKDLSNLKVKGLTIEEFKTRYLSG